MSIASLPAIDILTVKGSQDSHNPEASSFPLTANVNSFLLFANLIHATLQANHSCKMPGQNKSKRSQRKEQQRAEPEETQPTAGPSEVPRLVVPATPSPRKPTTEGASPSKRRLQVANSPTPHTTGDIAKDDQEAVKVLSLTKIRNKLPAEVLRRIQDAVDGNSQEERGISQLSNLAIDATPPPAKQRMIQEDRQRAESTIEARLQSKEANLAKAENLVKILNNGWHAGDLNLREDEFRSQVEQLERLITALRGDVVVIRTSRHELIGRLIDDMVWQQDRQNTDWAYLDALISRYKTPEGAKLSLFASRDPSAQERFRKKVLKAYDAVDEDMQWCVISGKYFPASTVRAAHIVSYNVGEPSAGHLFGPPGDKDGHLMSDKNGIPMYEMYEKAFDDSRLVIIPDGDPEKGCWKVYCLDDPDTHKPSKAVPFGRELHGRSLQFRNDFRPSSRYLYFAYCMSLLRRQRHEVPGWWRDFHADGVGKVWATPGTYLRTSTLRRLAHQVGHMTEEEVAEFAPGPAVEDEDVEKDVTLTKLVGIARKAQDSPTPATHMGKRVHTSRDKDGDSEGEEEETEEEQEGNE
ncbi:hypothetical protein MKX08_003417 [Trichoderma sp. CBMAI-0020]|nr:hypothetical protein MKX08_003417 [Trichoderma sp. CBMAI-0020]WOD46407.1 hypothetical protein [Trichoderma atroviride]